MELADEHIQTESLGALAGVNPFFGEWSGVFKFPPVSHTANHAHYTYHSPTSKTVRRVVVENGMAREIVETIAL